MVHTTAQRMRGLYDHRATTPVTTFKRSPWVVTRLARGGPRVAEGPPCHRARYRSVRARGLPEPPLRTAAMDPLRLSSSSAIRSPVLALLAAVAVGACATPRPPEAAGDATLSGSITYLPRIALPPDAVVHVRLQDVSRADAPSRTLAEETIPTEGRQVPIPFELRYDLACIEAGHRYSLRAEIRDGDGTLLWTTDTIHPVIAPGAPSNDIEIRLVQVQGAGALVGPAWRLARIEIAGVGSITPDPDEPYSITFQNDGRYSGQVDCNLLGGAYEVEADGNLEIEPGPMTLAACPPPSSSEAFLRVLLEVERYQITGNGLRLEAGDKGALVFEAG